MLRHQHYGHSGCSLALTRSPRPYPGPTAMARHDHVIVLSHNLQSLGPLRSPVFLFQRMTGRPLPLSSPDDMSTRRSDDVLNYTRTLARIQLRRHESSKETYPKVQLPFRQKKKTISDPTMATPINRRQFVCKNLIRCGAIRQFTTLRPQATTRDSISISLKSNDLKTRIFFFYTTS
ncbi:hypothetical protein H4582DRAFT_1242058 [Lactarius indigo]|nr:hypothetical protein H4582DRAFT_1242058 [Lactarius indigo]